MPRKPRTPSYRLHRSSGQAVVTLSGRDHYLGLYNSEASHTRYNQLVAEWLAASRQLLPEAVPDLTLSELFAAYILQVQGRQEAVGRPCASQVARITQAMGVADVLYGDSPASAFGPRSLRAVRSRMMEMDWSRNYINSCVGCIKTAFRWATVEELIPSRVYEAVRAVAGLEKGAAGVRDTEKVLSAPEHEIELVRPLVTYAVRDLIDLQLLTGMRPGEALAIRPCDIDRACRCGETAVWRYTPSTHKNAHRGQERPIFIGPRAQVLLGPYMDRSLDRQPDGSSFCFSPRETMTAFLMERRRKVRFGKTRMPGERYLVCSYSHAIRKACRKAGVEKPWHPHQLRHNAGTRLRAEFGADVARAILGHRSLRTTEIYAELDMGKAAQAMARSG